MRQIVWPVWGFILAALAAYRIQRIVTADKWPPSEWFRDKVAAKWGPESSAYTLVTCPWCFGFWIAAATVVVLQFWPNRWVMLVVHIMAASTVVGALGRFFQGEPEPEEDK